MLSQYATAAAATDRIRRRQESATAARHRAASSNRRRPGRNRLTALVAGVKAHVARPAHVTARVESPKLSREVHTAS
jgi:hypothetical protein